MEHWTWNITDYVIEEGNIVIRPSEGSGGNLCETIKKGTVDGKDYPGMFNKKRHIGFFLAV